MRRKYIVISFIVTYFNEGVLLKDCINSIIDSDIKYAYEIIVVNNSKYKDLFNKLNIKKDKNIKLLNTHSNLGFGKGINFGVEQSTGKYIFTITPDIKLGLGSINKIVDFAEKKRGEVAISPRIMHSDRKYFETVGTHLPSPIKAIFAYSFLNKYFPNNLFSKSLWIKTGNSHKAFKAEILPGVFLMKRTLFKKIGGFDERFFLYFEDTDLFTRFNRKGYDCYVLPSAVIYHRSRVLNSNNNKINNIFSFSRYKYFKKHYGALSALIVEFFARYSKYWGIMTIVLAIGIFLRFFNLYENINFSPETGHDYLRLKYALEKGNIPLIGPATQHNWISLGPLFYWIITPIFYIGGFLPELGAYFFAFIGVLLILINYYFVSQLANRYIAVISSAFIAFSPGWLELTRVSRVYFLAVVFFYPFVYFLHKSQYNGKYLFHTLLFLGIMLNFHLSVILLALPLLLYVYLNKEIFTTRHYINALFGITIPSVPFLITSMQQNFEPIVKIAAWVPYRVAGFLGLYEKNNMTSEIAGKTLNIMNEYVTKQYFWRTDNLSFFVFTLLTFWVVFMLLKKLKRKKYDFKFIVSLIFISGIVGLIVHGDPPIHYFVPIYAAVPILFAYALNDIFIKKRFVLLFAFVFLLFLTNLNYYKNSWFNYYKVNSVPDFISYKLQKEVAESVVNDVSGKKYVLKRKGAFDYYDEHFAQNYKYLMWLYGNEPVEESVRVYTIYEGADYQPDKYDGKIVFINDTKSLTVVFKHD